MKRPEKHHRTKSRCNKKRALPIVACAAAVCLTPISEAVPEPDIFRPVERMIRPEFASEKDKLEYAIKNMKRVQAAAERYASHHEGRFPRQADDAFYSYMIFGECDDKTYSTFSIPVNPYKPGGQRDRILTGNIRDPEQCRRSPPGALKPGYVEYSLSADGKNYSVRSGGKDGRALRDPNAKKTGYKTYVLSHDPTVRTRMNMRTVQWAAERYKEDRHVYPADIDADFKCYFPGGDPSKHREGRRLPNAFTGKLEWPVRGKVKNYILERLKPPDSIPPGVVEYNAVDGFRNYAIRGGDKNGKAIPGPAGPKTTLVISKDGNGFRDDTGI
ncbi:MAG TPA: hypothetical protein V6D17_20690 [Candidatus Obscuribacterales bacterium]